MLVIPAIDLKGGAVVRLYQGRAERETRYAFDPVRVALEWQGQKARWLHVVDLDGALSGRPRHRALLQRMVHALDVPIQFGGGLRTRGDIDQAFRIGVSRVILGSVALTDPGLLAEVLQPYGERIAVAIDGRGGKASISGWQEDLEASPLELAGRLKAAGVARIVYTDVSKDGTLSGPNVRQARRVAQESGLAVIASGGVSCLDDIRRLAPLQQVGVEGVIVGRALYERRFTLSEAIEAARG